LCRRVMPFKISPMPVRGAGRTTTRFLPSIRVSHRLRRDAAQPRPVFTIKQVAERLGVSPNRLLKRRDIQPALRLGARGAPRSAGRLHDGLGNHGGNPRRKPRWCCITSQPVPARGAFRLQGRQAPPFQNQRHRAVERVAAPGTAPNANAIVNVVTAKKVLVEIAVLAQLQRHVRGPVIA
jgi:hypothetical protein